VRTGNILVITLDMNMSINNRLPHFASYIEGRKLRVSKKGETSINSFMNLNFSSGKLSMGATVCIPALLTKICT
jgi:hypothetical protein